jgi:hypothetical protein
MKIDTSGQRQYIPSAIEYLLPLAVIMALLLALVLYVTA